MTSVPMTGFQNVLTFADMYAAAKVVAPVFLKTQFLNFLFGLRVSGLLVSLVLGLLALFFWIRVKKLSSKKTVKTGLSGIDKESLLFDKKINVMLRKIDDYISFENILYWKLALAEIDSYVNKVIVEIGFKGSDMSERLCKMSEEYLSNLEELKTTHTKVSEILNDNNYFLTKEETEALIEVYKNAINELRKM